MEEEDTKLCANCKREIPSVNYMTHSVHCARNLRSCPVCKEPVPVAELQEHHDSLHKEVPCKKCGESVCGTDLEDHIRDSCAQTIKPCRFCELELPRRSLPAHEAYCGARSEQCPDCREYVMAKYRQLHLDSNHGFIRLDDDPTPKEEKPKPKPVTKPIPKSISMPVTNGLPAPSTSNGITNNVRPATEIRHYEPQGSREDRGETSRTKITAKRTNDQPQINTNVEPAEKITKELPSRGAVKKRPAPPPPPPDPVRDRVFLSAAARAQKEEQQRQQQSAYNLSVGLPPVLSPAAKLDKLRKMDALHNREAEEVDYKNRLQGRVWMPPDVPVGNFLGSDGVTDLSHLEPMTAAQFMDRFQELQLGVDRRRNGATGRQGATGTRQEAAARDGGGRGAAGARSAGGARGDRFSEIKTSLQELRRGLNEFQPFIMDQDDCESRDPRSARFSVDPAVPRCEGQDQEALNMRRRAPSYASWAGEPRLGGRSVSRYGSEQPGVSRARDTEVGYIDMRARGAERQICRSPSLALRSLRTPDGFTRERSPSAGPRGSSAAVGRHSRGCSPTHGDERRASRSDRRRSRSSSGGMSELQPPSPKRRKSGSSDTGAILDKLLSVLQSVKSSDKPKMTFNTNIIPEFDPMSKEQTILTWLTKVEECAEIYGWEDKEIIHYAAPKLTGVARSWYQSLPTMIFTWPEWKNKLIESFPTRDDYAELLTEMLGKRVRYGESLDHYYYAKINLLNRCKIYGREAVDCLLHGVDDRAIKIGAQAGQFSEPEKVLKYFRKVKIAHSREYNETYSKFRNERLSTISTTKPSGPKPDPTKIICYNCDQAGHPSFECDRPLAKCTTCDKSGHLSIHCSRNKFNKNLEGDANRAKDNNEKQEAQLSVAE